MTYRLQIPTKQAHPIVLSAPHCGTRFPESFLQQSPLSAAALLETADLGTDILVDSLPELTSIKANYARSFVDLNRARHQLDHTVIEGLERTHNLQTISGYGVIPRFARSGALTHSGKISLEDAEARLKTFYDPYHISLEHLIGESVHSFGCAYLIDVHSAPKSILGEIDIQIGTLHGTSCEYAFREAVACAFAQEGLKVALETPFSGGFITEQYARLQNVQTLQIEVNRKQCVDAHNNLILNDNLDFLEKWSRAMVKVIASILSR